MRRTLDEASTFQLALGPLDGHPTQPQIPSGGGVGREVEVIPEPSDLGHVVEEGASLAAKRFAVCWTWYVSRYLHD